MAIAVPITTTITIYAIIVPTNAALIALSSPPYDSPSIF